MITFAILGIASVIAIIIMLGVCHNPGDTYESPTIFVDRMRAPCSGGAMERPAPRVVQQAAPRRVQRPPAEITQPVKVPPEDAPIYVPDWPVRVKK